MLVANCLLAIGALIWQRLVPGDPNQSLISNLAFITNSLSLSLLGLGVARSGIDRYTRRGWALIALASLSNGIGDVVWLIYNLLGLDPPFPSLADVFYLGLYPAMFAGILQFIQPPGGQVERRLFWVDLGLTAICVVTVVWYFPLRALLQHDQGSLFHDQGSLFKDLLTLAYPAGSSLLLIGVALWFARPRAMSWAVRSRYWLLGGLLAFLFADLAYVVQQSSDQYTEGDIVDALYHLGFLMMLTGAWSVIQAKGQLAAPSLPACCSWMSTTLPYLAIGAVYVLLIATALGWAPIYLIDANQDRALVILILVAATLTTLILIRQAIATSETARLRALQGLAQQERRFAALARYSSDLIWLVDAELRPQFTSASCERLLGWKPPQPVIASLFELIHPDDQPRAVRVIAKALSTQDLPLSTLWRMRHADGTWRDIEILVTNLSQHPAVGGLVLNGRDVTEHQRYQQALERARAAAEAANRAKDQFLANMSHEIRTPMQAITGLIDLVLESPLSPQQRDYLERVQAASHSLLALLNDILDYSKLEAGRMYLEVVPFYLKTLLKRTYDLFEIQAERKGLTLGLSVDPSIPEALKGDPLRLLQILNNLVGNALKFTPQGGVWVEVSCLDQTPEAAFLEFRVRDTGIGMTTEQIQRIFAVFQQGDASTSREYGGSGLGLSICKRLVELMGGTIGVESTPGQGSTFWFRVRLERAAPASEPRQVSSAGPPPTCLVPEDASVTIANDKQGDPPPTGRLALDPRWVEARLKELARLVDIQNSRARHLGRALLAELQGTDWQTDYEPIARAIAILDFASARQQLDQLLRNQIPAPSKMDHPDRP